MPDLRQSCATERPRQDAQPADALILFGAMGELAHRKIFPALYHMVERGRLNSLVIGVARAGRTDEHLREQARNSVQQHMKNMDQRALSKLLELLRLAATIRSVAPSNVCEKASMEQQGRLITWRFLPRSSQVWLNPSRERIA